MCVCAFCFYVQKKTTPTKYTRVSVVFRFGCFFFVVVAFFSVEFLLVFDFELLCTLCSRKTPALQTDSASM